VSVRSVVSEVLVLTTIVNSCESSARNERALKTVDYPWYKDKGMFIQW